MLPRFARSALVLLGFLPGVCEALAAECEAERGRVERSRLSVANLRTQRDACNRAHLNDPDLGASFGVPIACRGLSDATVAAERVGLQADRALAACLGATQSSRTTGAIGPSSRIQDVVATATRLFSMLFPPKPQRRPAERAQPTAPAGTEYAPPTATAADQAQMAREAAARQAALEAEQAALKAQQVREERDRATQTVKDRQDAWNRQQGLAPDSSKPSAPTTREELWRQQQAADRAREEEARLAIKPLLDIDLEAKFEELLQAVEKHSGIEAPDVVNDAIDDALQSTLGDLARIPPISQFLGDARERLMTGLRESVGGALCGPTQAQLSGTQEVDEAYTTFWSGVCGGWIGRPLSPSGVYGYLREEVVGKFNGFFDKVTASFGLMP